MSEALRETEFSVTSYRRLVVRGIVNALRGVYDGDYYRERQLANLKIATQYPLVKIDYPSMVVEFQGRSIMNAGVGHEEWFQDEDGIMRKWNHRRFEGTLNFSCHALSPLDLDILCDSLVEVLSFGRLDSTMRTFFTDIYGSPDDPVMLQFSQLMLNVDQINDGGMSAMVAPWQPEDVLVYSSDISIEIHGGFYNTYPAEQWTYITAVRAEPYPQGEVDVVLPFDTDPSTAFTNPFEYEDNNTTADPDNPLIYPDWLAAEGLVSGEEFPTVFDPYSIVTGVGEPDGVDTIEP